MRDRQHQIDGVDGQLERRGQDMQDLQNRLHEAERLLVYCTCTCTYMYMYM